MRLWPYALDAITIVVLCGVFFWLRDAGFPYYLGAAIGLTLSVGRILEHLTPFAWRQRKSGEFSERRQS